MPTASLSPPGLDLTEIGERAVQLLADLDYRRHESLGLPGLLVSASGTQHVTSPPSRRRIWSTAIATKNELSSNDDDEKDVRHELVPSDGDEHDGRRGRRDEHAALDDDGPITCRLMIVNASLLKKINKNKIITST